MVMEKIIREKTSDDADYSKIVYMDEDGKPVDSSVATKCRWLQLKDDGTIISRWDGFVCNNECFFGVDDSSLAGFDKNESLPELTPEQLEKEKIFLQKMYESFMIDKLDPIFLTDSELLDKIKYKYGEDWDVATVGQSDPLIKEFFDRFNRE